MLVKTDKGRDALARRVPELGPRLRSVLIMVDGQRSRAELDQLCAGLGGGADLLEQLLAHGWIAAPEQLAPFRDTVPLKEAQPQGGPQPVPAAGSVPVAEAAPPAPVVSPPLSFVDARRLVVRFINDQVGPPGEALAIRVEACKTAVELRTQLPRIRDALKNHRSAATVQRFDADVVPRLPTH
ncbi:MAG: hypothetical protein IV088_19415 [Hydrogenophaga sp.]|uniref:hypothetical protein n=1 Tax=Hydrogenophaga sp. TaxID=1904254 RepID=UPI0027EC6455|nr:hypothetical protein [Hydrogenophaga sp.]